MAMQQSAACVVLVQGKPLLYSKGMSLNQDMKLQFPLDCAATVLPEISFQGALLKIAPMSASHMVISTWNTLHQTVDVRIGIMCLL